MRFSNNTAGAGTYQQIYRDITEIRPYVDSEIVLSFEMKASVVTCPPKLPSV